MQRCILNKFNKKILCILILFTLIYSMLGFIPELMINSKAAKTNPGSTYTFKKSSNNLPSNFDSIYPGYRSVLQSLANSHPNWTFKLYETGLDWDTVINGEYKGHGGSPTNLVPKDYSSAWICPICGSRAYDNGSWRCASIGAIGHIMDPRNSITEINIFQYLLLSNDSSITREQVRAMAYSISYLNSQTVADGIYDAAQELNINPFYIIRKIIQEHGTSGSVLCLGNGYNGKYVGYYNLFNVKASGNTESAVIENGLAYAKSQGWNTPKKAIIGGIGLVNDYIKRGQDTAYYQKFNVTYYPYYVNQYAQNIFDGQSIGQGIRKTYLDNGLLECSFVFEIPLYKNMPSSPVSSPSSGSVSGELAYVNANIGLNLKKAPGLNSTVIAGVPGGTQVIITSRASSKVDGYYWDYVSTPYGSGYMARGASDGSKTYLVVVGSNSGTTKYQTSGNYVIVAPGATISTITGATNQSSKFATGSKILLNNKTYDLVMLGDANGDANITPADYVKVKNKIMGVTSMNTITQKAADVNRDGSITPADYVKIKNHIMNVSRISI